MTTSMATRLDRLAGRFRPASCYTGGRRCGKFAVVGDGTEDPPLPALPDVCARCGRPTSWSVVVIPGVDVEAL